jgi:GntR family transcriptional regulator / MocR family aminotransferase
VLRSTYLSDPWAISSADLHLDLTGTRIRASLEAALREAIRSGRLGAGVRLPSSRALAIDLGIARNTVAEAYAQLVAEGWLTARQGSGTRVAERGVAGLEARAAPPGVAQSATPYDLRPGSPDLSTFPRSAWLAAARRALSGAPDEALGYGDPRGQPALRIALAEYLARARGVRLTPDRIVICSGFTQAFGLLCRVLSSQGAKAFATEEFTQPGIRAIAASHGLSAVSVSVDDGGARISELGDNGGAVLLTPAHQFPLGVPLVAQRRAEAVTWARRNGALVIEDDYDGEFRYDRQPLGALQALAPEHVIYAGTASKTLAPGLRLAWLVLPQHLVDQVVEAKFMADRQSGSLEQLTLAEFIGSGAYDRHVRRSRLSYRRRRDHLVAELTQLAADVRITGIAAGLHALVELPAEESEQDAVARAAQQGLTIEGLHAYGGESSEHRPALVVGYGRPPAHAYASAVARLCAVLGGRLVDH